MSALDGSERQRLADLAVDACWAESPQTGMVAALWFSPIFVEVDQHPTARVIADRLGIVPDVAGRELIRMRGIARMVARQDAWDRRTA